MDVTDANDSPIRQSGKVNETYAVFEKRKARLRLHKRRAKLWTVNIVLLLLILAAAYYVKTVLLQ